MSPVVAVTHESMLVHRNPPGHPERPARLDAILKSLDQATVARLDARPIERRLLERVHAADYLDRLDALDGSSVQIDADTWIVPGSIEAARRAAGGVVRAVEHAWSEAEPAFALVRPPGHHAERDRAMGFCLFANVAAAAAHAIAELGASRVMIVDFDVHHGNGTQHAFDERDDVFVLDAHRGGGFWPGSGGAEERGRGAGEGSTCNLPYAAGTGDDVLVPMLCDAVGNHARAFAPDLIIVSAGYDAHEADPLGGCRVTDDGFAAITGFLQETAREVCGGRLALALEGGYEPVTVARCVARALDTLGS